MSDYEIYTGSSSSMSSFEALPFKFHDIETRLLGIPVDKSEEHPIFKLYKYSISDIPFEDKCQAIRYMQRCPHIKKYELCISSLTELLKDKSISFESKFKFFSNNDAYIKLDYEIVYAGHKWVFQNDSPLLYKVLSGQYLLSNTNDEELLNKIQEELLSISKDKNIEMYYRIECADILFRLGYSKYKKWGKALIKLLGKSTVGEHKINVHTILNESMTNTLRTLLDKSINNNDIDQIYLFLKNTLNDNLIEAFNYISIDTLKYEGKTLIEILAHLWNYILNSKNKKELEQRLLEELSDMNGTCTSGYITRLLNVVSGYLEKNISITFVEQLRMNVYARMKYNIKTLSNDMQNIILAEMGNLNHQNIDDFLFSYSPKEELWEEFKSHMDKDEFERIYKKSVEEYFGIPTKEFNDKLTSTIEKK